MEMTLGKKIAELRREKGMTYPGIQSALKQ